ncbi:ABC transporter substrate-binding protein [Actinomyces gaoshouyii]|uniref:ABC transporter substrate-binding protein n=1 Tax=Actinomyces gaoshouyii TaxID=1960083 RepID=A0A8H9LLZ4_9ACTO|nr:ABC transporter substrate-binding protein [Actinomyces gaoshouyii]ARD41425.1 ABC transporter substrate-binding protein [Actinomyces gaoshouyii]GGO99379.1 ABC transporter substrate-binding protein [Actinomyces gaoshouyii]
MAISVPRASRRDFIKISSTMGLAAGIAATLAACGGGTAKKSSTGAGSSAAPDVEVTNKDGVIAAGISYELGTNGYDPMTTTSALTVAANWHTMEGLTEIHPVTRECYPALGAALPTKVSDTSYEVALRDGAVFSDGTAVTVEDVVFSFERVLNPDNESLYASFLPFLDKVEKKDDKTVTLTLKYPFSLVAERVAVVKIVPKAAVEADAKAFDQMPVGTGPYVMKDNGAATKTVVFERNDKYNGSKPALAKSMTWQILPDDTTRTNAMSNGTVQAIDAVPAAQLTAMSAPIKVSAEQGFGLLFAMFNCGSEPMKDVKNRQAILYALDYESICKNGMAGLATPATCFVQKGHPAYRAAKVDYSTGGVEKAKALLAETGLKSVRLLCSDHGWFSSVRPIIKENLEAAGLTVTYEEKKSADVYNTIDGVPEAYDIVVAPGDPSVFGNDADLLLRWWYAGDTWIDKRLHWKGQESQTKIQEMLDSAVQKTGDEQVAAWQEIFDAISEVVPLYPIFHRKTPTAWNGDTLVNFKPITLTGLSFAGVGSNNS